MCLPPTLRIRAHTLHISNATHRNAAVEEMQPQQLKAQGFVVEMPWPVRGLVYGYTNLPQLLGVGVGVVAGGRHLGARRGACRQTGR